MADAAEPDAIWVISDVAPDGTYVTTVQAGPDNAVTLDRDAAVAYTLTALTAAARAAYDAAVFAQMTTMGLDERAAAGTVMNLRGGRPPLNDAATAPLRFEPFLAYRTKAGAVYVERNGERIAQWTVADTEGHAMHVLGTCVGVDLDAAYRRYLVGVVGIDDARARAAVGDILNHRQADDG